MTTARRVSWPLVPRRLTVEVSRSRLHKWLAAMSGDHVLDLRHDAWGIGLERVLPLLAENPCAVCVDAAEGDRARAAGLVVVEASLCDNPLVARRETLKPPVIRVLSRVATTKRLRAGDGVSYGLTWRAKTDTTVALVAGGYAQGVVRALGNRASVLVEGERAPIVGRVAMDVCVIDVGSRVVRSGTEVVLLGDPEANEPPVAEWVSVTGLAPDEVVIPLCARGTAVVVP